MRLTPTSHLDLYVPVADVSVNEASSSFEPHPNVKMVETVLEEAPADPDITLIKGSRSSAAGFEKACVVPVNLGPSNADDDDADGKAVAILNLSRNG